MADEVYIIEEYLFFNQLKFHKQKLLFHRASMKYYENYLKENKFKISCAAKGNPYENAFAESFMKTLKNDQVDLFKYATIIDVIENIPEFLEEVYNKKRLHSALNYLTPEEFEAKCIKKNRTRP